MSRRVGRGDAASASTHASASEQVSPNAATPIPPASASSSSSSLPLIAFSADRAESSLITLKAELHQFRRRLQISRTDAAATAEVESDRQRMQELETEITHLQSALREHRRQQSGIAVFSLVVLLLISIIWILAGWDSPLKWMEEMQLANRHAAMLRDMANGNGADVER